MGGVMSTKMLAVVTGANGSIGRAYLEQLRKVTGVRCVAVSRNTAGIQMDGVNDLYVADLTDSRLTTAAFGIIDPSSVDTVLLIHAVGRFAFEDASGESAIATDPAIVRSNVATCTNSVDALLTKVRAERAAGHDIRFVVCTFGSISDQYTPELWRSFTAAKNMLRNWLSELVRRETNMAALFINVSSIDTAAEQSLRPSISEEEREYWLQPHELVERSWNLIEGLCAQSVEVPWQEVAIFKESPYFHDRYYDKEHAGPRWQRAMRGRR